MVMNLLSKQLQREQLSVLRKGLKFTPALRYVPSKEMITAIEGGLEKLSEGEAAYSPLTNYPNTLLGFCPH